MAKKYMKKLKKTRTYKTLPKQKATKEDAFHKWWCKWSKKHDWRAAPQDWEAWNGAVETAVKTLKIQLAWVLSEEEMKILLDEFKELLYSK